MKASKNNQRQTAKKPTLQTTKQNRSKCYVERSTTFEKLFFKDEGFSTVGAAVALLITLSLIFSAAQVYRTHSVSADIQNVADASVLAAENEIAEFMIVARTADAVLLSLTLTGVTAYGLGIAALCTPATATLSGKLLELGEKVLEARQKFSEKAIEGLNKLQKVLPFLAAANAAAVAGENSDYAAFTVLFPAEGKEIAANNLEGVEELQDGVAQNAETIKEAAAEAERAAEEANKAKLKAFEADCGNNPGYCMYERASSLASLSTTENPLYNSVDTWSFEIALKRALFYYQARQYAEAPQGSSVNERANSALRKIFYDYASKEVAKGYVRETEDRFEAYFPLLPKNTQEMRESSLYTAILFPVTNNGGSYTMHAWEGCPRAAGYEGKGSISHMEHGGYAQCPTCKFTAASLGKVASASTAIENGFEYHYNIVACAAADYKNALDRKRPYSEKVKAKTQGLFDLCKEILASANNRIEVEPPGSLGAMSFVVSTQETSPSTGFESSFVSQDAALGTRAALSAATLLEEPAGETGNVIASLLDGFTQEGGVGAAGIVLDCWSGCLMAYTQGQNAVRTTIKNAIDAIPFVGASGLGTWAADAFSEVVEGLGLQPTDLDALKPVLLNSEHVASKDEGMLAARYLQIKEQMLSYAGSSSSLFSSLVGNVEEGALEALGDPGEELEIAILELPVGGVSIPLTITLPPAVREYGTETIQNLAKAVRSAGASITDVRAWE